MNDENRKDLEERIFLLFDGDLDNREVDELDLELRASREARDIFRQSAALHSALEEQGGANINLVRPPLVPIDRILEEQRRGMVRNAMLATAAIVMVSVFFLWFKMAARTPTEMATLVSGPDAEFRLIHDDLKDAGGGLVLREGSRLRLSKGTMKVEFESGVLGLLEAPGDFTVLSDERIKLAEGALWLEVPSSAVGFTVETEQFTVVDLGTEFGVRAVVGGEHEVHVFKGAVEISSVQPEQKERKIELKAGEARKVDARGEFHRIEPEPDRFTTSLPEEIFIANASFEEDRNTGPDGLFADGERDDFGGQLTGWISQSGKPSEVQVGWRGIEASELHPHPAGKGRDSQALSLISGASVLNATDMPWSSLRAGDSLTLAVSIGLRDGNPRLHWNEATFFGLADGNFDPVDIPTPADTLTHSGVLAENPATGDQAGDGTFRDVSLEYKIRESDLRRPGNIGILLVGKSSQLGNSEHQSFFDNVRLRLKRGSLSSSEEK